jgi:hypothetical protein
VNALTGLPLLVSQVVLAKTSARLELRGMLTTMRLLTGVVVVVKGAAITRVNPFAEPAA